MLLGVTKMSPETVLKIFGDKNVGFERPLYSHNERCPACGREVAASVLFFNKALSLTVCTPRCNYEAYERHNEQAEADGAIVKCADFSGEDPDTVAKAVAYFCKNRPGLEIISFSTTAAGATVGSDRYGFSAKFQHTAYLLYRLKERHAVERPAGAKSDPFY